MERLVWVEEDNGLISKEGLPLQQDNHLKKEVRYILEAANRYCQKSDRVRF